MQRAVLFINIPAFYIELVRLRERRLCGRPVAAVAPGEPHARIRMLSHEAFLEGVRKGMTASSARKYCRDLVVLPRDSRVESRAFRDLKILSARYTPLWEPLKPGHVFMDLTGTERLWGAPRDAAGRIREAVREHFQMICRTGIAGNKLVARIAARAAERGEIREVAGGGETCFLKDFPAEVLPSLKTPGCLGRLSELNLQRVADLQGLSQVHLAAAFGRLAFSVKREALGIDASPVNLPSAVPEVREEAWFDCDENDDAVLLSRLSAMLALCLHRLRVSGRTASRVALRVRYADGREARRQESLDCPSFWRFDMVPVMRGLFFKAVQRRVQVRFLELIFTGLGASGTGQLSLDFTEDGAREARAARLDLALDAIHRRLGMRAVRFGL